MKKKCNKCGLILGRNSHYCPKCTGVMEEVGKKIEVKKPSVEHIGGGWYLMPDGSKIQGKENAMEMINDGK